MTTGASVTLSRSALAPHTHRRQQPGHDLSRLRRETEASLAWVRIDDGFPEHPKLRSAGPLGRELFVAALCHCNRYLTDGRLTLDDLRRLGQYEGLFIDGLSTLPGVHEPPRVEDVLERLLGVGAIHFEEGAGLYEIHDYASYQPVKAQVLADREAAKERMRKKRGLAGFSNSEPGKFARTSGRGSKENHLGRDVHAREAKRPCAECGVGGGHHVLGCSQTGEAVA